MATIKTTERLLKRVILSELFMPDGLAVTPLLSGAPGIGKTAICNAISKKLGGITFTVEGGSLKEGELPGLPKTSKNPDGSEEMVFVPYHVISKVQKLEKFIYQKALQGFKTNNIKLNEDGSISYELDNKEYIIPAKSEFEKIIDGEQNKYEFGSQLPPEVKLNLIKNKEICPVVILLDEMNRTDVQTMKEFMNIILTKIINGYKLPWWAFFVAAINPATQNSIYSVNEFDDAQIDRFLKISVSVNFNEWIEYALNKRLNQKYIQAMDQSVFIDSKSKIEDEIEMRPTPRSHEICIYLYDAFETINKSGFFSAEELKDADSDLATLIRGKIGSSAGNAMVSKLNSASKLIPAESVINGKTPSISNELKDKIENSETLVQKILVTNVIDLICTDYGKYYFTSSKPENKNTWENICTQFAELIKILTPSIRVYFASQLIKSRFDIPEFKKQYENNKEIPYYLLGKYFASDILSQICDLKQGFSTK